MNKFYSRAYICLFLLLGAQTACLADVSDSVAAGKTLESKATKVSIDNRIQNGELINDGAAVASKRVHLHSSLTEQIDQARCGLSGISSGHYIMPGATFSF